MLALKGPPGRWLTGHLADFRKNRLGFFTRCAREYGDVVPLRIMGKRMLLISRPDLIEQILVTQARHFIKHFGLRVYVPVLGDGLVTAEGDHWRRQRKLAAPAFQSARMGEYAEMMTSATTRMLTQWSSDAKTNFGEQAPVARDVHADLMRVTLEIVCQTLFGADACPQPDAVGQWMHDALQAITPRFNRPFPLPEWLPLPSNRRLYRALRPLDAVVEQIVERARAQPASHTGTDLLSTLLHAKDEDGAAMSNRQLLDEVRTLFLAGHETTALAVTYTLYLLAKNPETQRKLQDELDRVLPDRTPAYSDLPALAFTHNVVTESMRLFPPADVLGREAIDDCTIGEVPVKKGMTCFMSQWVMHHDPRYFADPDRFDPDRWTPAFQQSLPRFAYFPFGGGPRFCIGQSFAMTEAILLVATICRSFAFAPDPNFELALWPSITLRPRDGLRLVVSPRNAE